MNILVFSPDTQLPHGATRSLIGTLVFMLKPIGGVVANVRVVLFSSGWMWSRKPADVGFDLLFRDGERNWYLRRGLSRIFRLVLESVVAIGRAVKFVRHSRAKLVYVNTIEFGTPVVGARIAGVPVVVHVREAPEYFVGKNIVAQFRLKALRFLASGFIVNSVATAKCLGNVGVSKSRIRVVPNFLDLDHWKRGSTVGLDVVNKFGWHGASLIVLCVSRMSREKGVADFVQAARSAIGIAPNCRFIVLGGPLGGAYYDKSVKPLLEGGWAEESVRFLGEVDDPRPFMEAAHIVVVPSHMESFGRVGLEAMAMSLPVVATRVGGIPEVVVDGITGLLVEPSSPAQMSAAILRLACDPDLRSRMGQAGRVRAENYFSQEVVMAQLIEELWRVAGLKKPSCGLG